MSLIPRIRAFARRYDLWRPDTRVVAGLSGGCDSVALLLLLRDLARSGDLILSAAAHLNHGIRAAAEDDEAFCRGLCARLDVPFVSERVDVPAIARRDKLSVEVAARNERHRFLNDTRLSLGADVVATAHTQDDQAETVLLRLLRGSGLTGVAGIRPRRGDVVRPLLDITREELRAELAMRAEPWREDETNQDVKNPRNRLRHVILPALTEHFNPAATRALARFADLARADDDWARAVARQTATGLLRVEGDRVLLDAAALCALPEGLARRVARRALETAHAELSYRLEEVDLLREIAAGRSHSRQLAGLSMERFGSDVVLTGSGAAARAVGPFRHSLPIPGLVRLPEIGWQIEALGPCGVATAPLPDTAPGDGVESAATVEAAALAAEGLVVRNRRPGDALRPLGLGGRKKLQDLFVDRKVRREERDRVPIVTDTGDRIVWVAGHAVAEEFRVCEDTKAVVVLKLRRIE